MIRRTHDGARVTHVRTAVVAHSRHRVAGEGRVCARVAAHTHTLPGKIGEISLPTMQPSTAHVGPRAHRVFMSAILLWTKPRPCHRYSTIPVH